MIIVLKRKGDEGLKIIGVLTAWDACVHLKGMSGARYLLIGTPKRLDKLIEWANWIENLFCPLRVNLFALHATHQCIL